MTDRMRKVLEGIIRERKTPSYLFDIDALQAETDRFRRCLGGEIGLNYSMKANSFITRAMASFVDRIEVCSMGEFRICRDLGLAPEKLFISGVLKKEADLEEILAYAGNGALYTAESPDQFRQLAAWAATHETELRVYPRLTSGNQFGMDADTVRGLVMEARDLPYLTVEGIHFFSGTMKKTLRRHQKELDMLDSFLLSLQEAGCGVTHLEYGTGFAVPYFDPVKEVTTRDENLTAFAEMTRAMTWKGRVNIEMGRALSACCGYYMTAILDQKVSDGTGWIITDGGIHQIGYDGQIKGMYKPFITLLRGSEENRKEWPVSQWTVCGSLCTVNDILCRDLELDQPQKGDVLVFERAGAYCVTEGMALFLSHELPEILLYSDRDGLFCAREMMETCDLNRGRL